MNAKQRAPDNPIERFSLCHPDHGPGTMDSRLPDHGLPTADHGLLPIPPITGIGRRAEHLHESELASADEMTMGADELGDPE